MAIVLYPEEVEITSKKEAIKILDKSKVKIGPSESMSKSKKNTVDPGNYDKTIRS